MLPQHTNAPHHNQSSDHATLYYQEYLVAATQCAQMSKEKKDNHSRSTSDSCAAEDHETTIPQKSIVMSAILARHLLSLIHI
jgi:hypothetical protein